LSRAEHRRGGREKARGLSEPAVAKAKAGEFPRAPAAPTTRREVRSTAGHGRLKPVTPFSGKAWLVRFLPRGRKWTAKKDSL